MMACVGLRQNRWLKEFTKMDNRAPLAIALTLSALPRRTNQTAWRRVMMTTTEKGLYLAISVHHTWRGAPLVVVLATPTRRL